jgi:hypothetical protein
MRKIPQEILDQLTGHSSPYDILEQYQAGIPIHKLTLKYARIWAKVFYKLDWLNTVVSVSGQPVLDVLYSSSMDGLAMRILMATTIKHYIASSCQKWKNELDIHTSTPLNPCQATANQLLEAHEKRWPASMTKKKQKELDLLDRQPLRVDKAASSSVEKLITGIEQLEADVSYFANKSETTLLYPLEWSERKGPRC